jgi:hypothetical protein
MPGSISKSNSQQGRSRQTGNVKGRHSVFSRLSIAISVSRCARGLQSERIHATDSEHKIGALREPARFLLRVLLVVGIKGVSFVSFNLNFPRRFPRKRCKRLRSLTRHQIAATKAERDSPLVSRPAENAAEMSQKCCLRAPAETSLNQAHQIALLISKGN